MAKIDKYTVIITNYNNDEYILSAIESILEQNYQNIQLIITDDCSKKFDKKLISNYINKNKKRNIKEIEFIINSKNLGTVKTLNKALKKATGEYILFFAADDKLGDKTVLSKFANEFNRSGKNVITTQWKKCDENLKPLSNILNPYEAKKYNIKNIKYQLYRLCRSNIYGSGATSYKKEVFEKYGYLDEGYKYLEDWPLWIRLLSKNEKIYFSNFTGLLHRSGGISGENNTVTPVKKKFCQELLDNFYKEIIPQLNRFSNSKKIKILKSYQFHINNYSFAVPPEKYNNQLKEILRKNKYLKLLWYINKIVPNLNEKIIILFKYNKIVPITVIIHLLTNFIIVNYWKLTNNRVLLTYLISYFIIYSLVNFTYNIYKLKQK